MSLTGRRQSVSVGALHRSGLMDAHGIDALLATYNCSPFVVASAGKRRPSAASNAERGR
jgi:hypothetical protein